MVKRVSVWAGVALMAAFGPAVASAQDATYVGWSAGEPWGMYGNVNAMDDVFGPGNWDRLDFPTAVGNGLWNYNFIFMDGSGLADAEFVEFVDANRAAMEAWVAGGGHLIMNAARVEYVDDFNLGCGFMMKHSEDERGYAVDDTHPIYNGPWGYTGTLFVGDLLAHDYLWGGIGLMTGDWGQVLLAESPYGAGHVIAGGLTLPFFGEYAGWSNNCDEFHRNLLYYGYYVPEPGTLTLLLGALVLVRRR